VHRQAVLNFVRTPFAVRRNVVRIWRPIPTNAWLALAQPEDVVCSRRRERCALCFVTSIVVVLGAGFASVGYRQQVGKSAVDFPVLGWSLPAQTDVSPADGWYAAPGQSVSLVSWTVVPPLVGWAFIRGLWIPRMAAGKPRYDATLAFARHLSGVYVYVYLMIFLGALLLPMLVLASPAGTQGFRWCLWCFLFGESFFVPAVMWMRLIVNDRLGETFGRSRYLMLAAYLVIGVFVPITGMVTELP
jgi:hypothetical protein